MAQAGPETKLLPRRMQLLRRNRLLWIGAICAVLCMAIGYMVTASAAGMRCKTTACTYIDASSGQQRPGTCGTKKGDEKNCYCVANDDKKLIKVQLGCSVSAEK